jgi:uncharacterized damage-inducible protein DinB
MTVAPPTIERPGADEYTPYYGTYIGRVPDGDLVSQLAVQGRATAEFLATVPESRGDFRYAPGKWSVKDVIGHLSDTERIMSYRLLRIARADRTPLASFEENDYVPAAHADRRTVADLAAELQAVRAATLALLRGLDAEAFARRGTASGKGISARALAWIIAGHELHHVAVLRERYQLG